jgi:hypothetical protein
LHSFPPQLVDTLIVGTVKDILLVGRLNHADVAEIVDEETASGKFRLLLNEHMVLTQVL